MSAVQSAVIQFPMGRVRPAVQLAASGAGEAIIFPGVQTERLKCHLAERLPAIRTGSAAQARGDFDFY